MDAPIIDCMRRYRFKNLVRCESEESEQRFVSDRVSLEGTGTEFLGNSRLAGLYVGGIPSRSQLTDGSEALW